MDISYNKLWNKLYGMGIDKKALAELTGVSMRTISRMAENHSVSVSALEKICAALNCGINEIVQMVPEGCANITSIDILLEMSKLEEEEKNMEESDIKNKLTSVEPMPQFSILFEDESEQSKLIAKHKAWLQSIRHERPNAAHPYKVGVYIRYFNQTKYDNYLSFHKKQFADSIALCPRWELVDFYVDEGASPPNMENATEWSRLLEDAMDGKVDLIITQKVSNVSKSMDEMAICAQFLAVQTPPIGIYFISEDIFTLASYYDEDLRSPEFLPDPDWKSLEERNSSEIKALLSSPNP